MCGTTLHTEFGRGECVTHVAWHGELGSGKGDVVIRVLNCLCSFQLRYLDGDVNIDIKYRQL